MYREPSRWLRYYLTADPVYRTSHFRKHFPVPLSLFRLVFQDLVKYEPFTLCTQRGAIGREGIKGEVKVLVCLRLLGHARSHRDLDDSAQMGKEPKRNYFHLFCANVRAIYVHTLLNRRTTREELVQILERYGASGLPGYIDAMDSMKIKWQNFQISHEGQYKNRKYGSMKTMGMEAWCDRYLYCLKR